MRIFRLYRKILNVADIAMSSWLNIREHIDRVKKHIFQRFPILEVRYLYIRRGTCIFTSRDSSSFDRLLFLCVYPSPKNHLKFIEQIRMSPILFIWSMNKIFYKKIHVFPIHVQMKWGFYSKDIKNGFEWNFVMLLFSYIALVFINSEVPWYKTYYFIGTRLYRNGINFF